MTKELIGTLGEMGTWMISNSIEPSARVTFVRARTLDSALCRGEAKLGVSRVVLEATELKALW